MTTEPTEPRNTGRLSDESNSGAAAATASESDWPDLDQLVESVKAKRAEEVAREEERRNAVQRAAQEAQRVWSNLNAEEVLQAMAARLSQIGVVARPVETLAGAQSAAMEFSRLPKGEAATIRIDTAASRSGPPRTTIQVQRGTQQLSPVTLATNTQADLRKALLDIAQRLVS